MNVAVAFSKLCGSLSSSKIKSGTLKSSPYHAVFYCHTLDKLEVNIQAEIAVIQEKELKSMAINCLKHDQQCLDVGCMHLQHIL
jgi:hypothetical protein